MFWELQIYCSGMDPIDGLLWARFRENLSDYQLLRSFYVFVYVF
jgi:hypothetical protein